MSTGYAIALTIFICAAGVAFIGHKSRTIGPLLHLGLALGLAIGISGSWLFVHVLGV
jgi:hypothetical protein